MVRRPFRSGGQSTRKKPQNHGKGMRKSKKSPEKTEGIEGKAHEENTQKKRLKRQFE